MPENTQATKPLLSVRNLKTYFPVKRGLMQSLVGHVQAVDDVSFDVAPGETLGLVGESGCGKSTVGRTLLRLIPSTEGSITFDGQDVLKASSTEMKKLRRQMQMIFQDPVGSLNPRMKIRTIVGEPMRVHNTCAKDEVDDQVAELLVKVGLDQGAMDKYPHEFSGGQRQRVGIARALSLKPKFIVCDEPVSALDVSVQSQVLNLLKDLQEEFGLSYLFIAHNLAVVEHFCDRVAVMYLGKIVEIADRQTLYKNPVHAYTRALLSAAPTPDPAGKTRRIMLVGDVPSPIKLFNNDDGPGFSSGISESDQSDIKRLRKEGYDVVTREQLLDRPALVPVDGEPGHFVSPTADEAVAVSTA